MSKIRTKNAQRRFQAHRDTHGVPHIRGATWLDVLYGLGYLHATDRGTQMLFSRVVASGTAAKRIADQPELIETDSFFRRAGLYLNLDREVRLLDDSTFRQLTAYCEGVNDGLKGSGRSLPMWATGFQPRPWDQRAVLLIGNLLSFGGLAISQLENERLLIELIHAGVDDDALRELFDPLLDDVDFDLVRSVKMSNRLSNDALELLTDLPRLAGSNAWAVSPERSASGGALLAGDPHLEINRLPAIWYEAALRWDGGYVMGASLPGCPLFAVARTANVAWSVTYMKGDTLDFFIEDCRRGGESGWQYRRSDDWHDFHVRGETIERKGNGPLAVPVYSNKQGTLDTDLEALGEGKHLSIAWAGSQPGSGGAITSWLDVIQCSTAAAAMDVARDCPQPTLCWVFADRAGHIGLQACGRFPKRSPGIHGMAPIPAWDEANHWQGWLSKDVLPRIYDPAEGYICTANENINSPDGPMLVTQPVPDHRKRRIAERLAELPQATLDDMRAMQYDLVSLQARDMLELLMPHLPAGSLRDRLEKWDYRYASDSMEATLFQRLYRNVIIEVFGSDDRIGWRRMLYLCSRTGFSVMVLTAADRVLHREQSHWWRGRDKAELIRRAAEQTEKEPEVPWSDVNNFHFTDRFFGTHRVGRALGFASPRHSMPGCHATIFQGHVLQTATRESTFAPSYHFVTDLSTDEAHTNLPGGPSESRFSKYYKCDVPLWFAGEYKILAVDE